MDGVAPTINYETVAAPSGEYWVWSQPELIGLDSTEWWFVYEQIVGALCMCTDCGYNDTDQVQADWKWTGTIITPGKDRYKVVANASRPATLWFMYVEKLECVN